MAADECESVSIPCAGQPEEGLDGKVMVSCAIVYRPSCVYVV